MICILCHFLLSFICCGSCFVPALVKWSVSWLCFYHGVWIVYQFLSSDVVCILTQFLLCGLYCVPVYIIYGGLYSVLLYWVPYNVFQPSLSENCYLCINCTVTSMIHWELLSAWFCCQQLYDFCAVLSSVSMTGHTQLGCELVG